MPRAICAVLLISLARLATAQAPDQVANAAAIPRQANFAVHAVAPRRPSGSARADTLVPAGHRSL